MTATTFSSFLRDNSFAVDYRSVEATEELYTDEEVARPILTENTPNSLASREAVIIFEGPLARYLATLGIGGSAIAGGGQLFPSQNAQDRPAAVAPYEQEFDRLDRQAQDLRRSSHDFQLALQQLSDRMDTWENSGQQQRTQNTRASAEENQGILHHPSEDNTISDMVTLINMLIDIEGFHHRAYVDSGGTVTIGYGFTRTDIPNLSMGDTISRSEANSLLRRRLERHYIPIVFSNVDVPITDNQAIALASFVYNVGQTAFRNSTLLDKLNRGDYEGAAREFRRWVRSGGEELPGLISRRELESSLFRQDIQTVQPDA